LPTQLQAPPPAAPPIVAAPPPPPGSLPPSRDVHIDRRQPFHVVVLGSGDASFVTSDFDRADRATAADDVSGAVCARSFATKAEADAFHHAHYQGEVNVARQMRDGQEVARVEVVPAEDDEAESSDGEDDPNPPKTPREIGGIKQCSRWIVHARVFVAARRNPALTAGDDPLNPYVASFAVKEGESIPQLQQNRPLLQTVAHVQSHVISEGYEEQIAALFGLVVALRAEIARDRRAVRCLETLLWRARLGRDAVGDAALQTIEAPRALRLVVESPALVQHFNRDLRHWCKANFDAAKCAVAASTPPADRKLQDAWKAVAAAYRARCEYAGRFMEIVADVLEAPAETLAFVRDLPGHIASEVELSAWDAGTPPSVDVSLAVRMERAEESRLRLEAHLRELLPSEWQQRLATSRTAFQMVRSDRTDRREKHRAQQTLAEHFRRPVLELSKCRVVYGANRAPTDCDPDRRREEEAEMDECCHKARGHLCLA